MKKLYIIIDRSAHNLVAIKKGGWPDTAEGEECRFNALHELCEIHHDKPFSFIIAEVDESELEVTSAQDYITKMRVIMDAQLNQKRGGE